MTDLQLFESLCAIIGQQAEIIRDLTFELRQLDAVSDEVEERLYMLETACDELAEELQP